MHQIITFRIFHMYDKCGHVFVTEFERFFHMSVKLAFDMYQENVSFHSLPTPLKYDITFSLLDIVRTRNYNIYGRRETGIANKNRKTRNLFCSSAQKVAGSSLIGF